MYCLGTCTLRHYTTCTLYILPYSGKFSLGAIFHVFHEQVQIREIKHLLITTPSNYLAYSRDQRVKLIVQAK